MLDLTKAKNIFDFNEIKATTGINDSGMIMYFLSLGTYLFAKHHYPDLPTEEAVIKAQTIFRDNVATAVIDEPTQQIERPKGCCGGGEVK